MEILIVSATQFEVDPITSFLKKIGKELEDRTFEFNKNSIHILITGVGMVNTSYHLTKLLSRYRPQLIINAGIAGSFNRDFPIGSVYKVVKQYFGDLGVEEADKSFTDLFELELLEDKEPFQNKAIINNSIEAFDFLPSASCITVNKVHGTEESIALVKNKYNADLEVMEGAALAYICTMEQLNYLEVRAVSNYVEKRNKENWNIPKAIHELNQTLVEILSAI